MSAHVHIKSAMETEKARPVLLTTFPDTKWGNTDFLFSIQLIYVIRDLKFSPQYLEFQIPNYVPVTANKL